MMYKYSYICTYISLLSCIIQAYADDIPPLSSLSTNRDNGFMVDRQYERRFMTIWNKTFVDNWGFANESYLPLNHKGYDEIISKCDFNANKMILSDYSPLATANYYPTTADFTAYSGIDLIPVNQASYVKHGDFADHLQFDHKNRNHDPIMMHTCKLSDDDKPGGTIIQRIGPFTSTGGYDWWQVGWPNVGLLDEILTQHPDGIDIIKSIITPVYENGERIGHPPIHIHHIHAVAQPGVRPRNIIRGVCIGSSGTSSSYLDSLIKEENCYNSSLIFEQHGDYQCHDDQDGIDCLVAGSHNHRRISQALDIEGSMNDVRPAGSSDMTWYFQVIFEWQPINHDIIPVSQITIMAPGQATTYTDRDQLKRAVTFPTPTHAEHMIWYRGAMIADGELIRNKLHAHSVIFESSVFFIGIPSDLGLDDARFQPIYGYQPLNTHDLGFDDNDDISEYIMSNLIKSQDYYDQQCHDHHVEHDTIIQEHILDLDYGDQEIDYKQTSSICDRPRPKLLCAASFDHDSIGFGDPMIFFSFDRRPHMYCEPWSFKKDDAFVVVAFSRKIAHPISPVTPMTIPATIPGHVSWHLWYHHIGYGHSAFGRIICNQQGLFFDSNHEYSVLEVAAIVTTVSLYGGIPADAYVYDMMKNGYLMICYGVMLFIIMAVVSLFVGMCRRTVYMKDIMVEGYKEAVEVEMIIKV